MTLQHFLRTVVIAILGAAALALATQAKAEGGEGSSVIPPEKFENVEDVTPSDDAKIEVAEEEEGAEQVDVSPAQGKMKAKLADELRAKTLKPLIARYASQHDIPFELANAVIQLESRYNPSARNGPNVGLTQINVRTAQSLGYQGEAAGLMDAETNLRYGLKYLAQAYKLAGGDTCGTILRYQFGHRTQTMTSASRVYCAKVKVLTASAE